MCVSGLMVVDQATKSSSDPYDREEHAQAFCACIQWLGLASSGAPVLQMFRWTLMDSKMEMVNLGLGRLFPPHGSGGEVGSESESEQHPVWRDGKFVARMTVVEVALPRHNVESTRSWME